MDKILFQKLQRLKEELFYLKKNKSTLLKKLRTSVEAKKIAERSVYLCAEIVLDIADLIIINKGFPKASTYSDSIYKLGMVLFQKNSAINSCISLASETFLLMTIRKAPCQNLKNFSNLVLRI
jgi:uncharacterized protein YutE (UPF0331/DUF86 family)